MQALQSLFGSAQITRVFDLVPSESVEKLFSPTSMPTCLTVA